MAKRTVVSDEQVEVVESVDLIEEQPSTETVELVEIQEVPVEDSVPDAAPEPVVVVAPRKVVRVNRLFRGRLSKERVIAEGVYEVDDKQLYGLGDYLIENGFAEYAEV